LTITSATPNVSCNNDNSTITIQQAEHQIILTQQY
jgi:hypothetical protein